MVAALLGYRAQGLPLEVGATVFTILDQNALACDGTGIDDTHISLFRRINILMPIIKKQAPCGVCLILINSAS
jgi:hypothetical protein